jgi:hypothetical protein
VTLKQMSLVKRWHVLHRERHGLEYGLWDAMLTCWVVGCVGLPVEAVLHEPWGMALCLPLWAAPHAYGALRLRLHRTRRLRCDWADLLRTLPQDH